MKKHYVDYSYANIVQNTGKKYIKINQLLFTISDKNKVILFKSVRNNEFHYFFYLLIH